MPLLKNTCFYSHPDVLLKDHLKEVGTSCAQFAKGICGSGSGRDLASVAELIGKSHDLGKYTKYFQDHLAGRSVGGDLSSHSKISALLASWLVNRRLKDELHATLSLLCVESHHGSLKSMEHLKNIDRVASDPVLKKQIDSLKESLPVIESELNEIGICEVVEVISGFESCMSELGKVIEKARYRLIYDLDDERKWYTYYDTLFIFSSLIDSDKKSAGKVPFINWDSKQRMTSSELKEIMKRRFCNMKADKINELRNEIFFKVTDNLDDALSKSDRIPRLFTITAPTGSGKTLLGLYAALRIREKLNRNKRIIYCLPYINIIDQTHSTFEGILSQVLKRKEDSKSNNESPSDCPVPLSILLKHHHLFSPQDSGEVPLEKTLLMTESWDSDIVVTTFEQMVKAIIGCSNSSLKKTHNLADSVVILDEVQAIPCEYWALISEALYKFSDRFDTTLLLMTATMPVIFKGTELLPSRNEYYKKMQRTVLKPELHSPVSPDGFADFFLRKWKEGEKKSALLVLNTIRTSKLVYNRIADEMGDDAIRLPDGYSGDAGTNKPILVYLSTSIVPNERRRRVERIKTLLASGKKVILVSTQVVEAGVDLDFDSVFRDLGPLDSIVQVAGRCNRNWRNSSAPVYILRVVDDHKNFDANKIYGKILPEVTLKVLEKNVELDERHILMNAEDYYREISERMNLKKSEESFDTIRKIKCLDFSSLGSFTLIKEKGKIPVFVEIDQKAKSSKELFLKLLKECESANNLEEVMRCRAKLRKARVCLEEYIVQTYGDYINGLRALFEGVQLFQITNEEIYAYYDPETGLKGTMEANNEFIF